MLADGYRQHHPVFYGVRDYDSFGHPNRFADWHAFSVRVADAVSQPQPGVLRHSLSDAIADSNLFCDALPNANAL